MAGIGLFIIVAEVSILVLVCVVISLMSKSKKSLYCVYAIDAIVFIQSLIVFSNEWRRNDDIFLRNIFIFQVIFLCFLTYFLYKRVSKDKNLINEK
jgi:hypothetical protein